MAVDQQTLPLITAVFTALAAVLIAPFVQLIVGLRQAHNAKLSAEAAKISAEAALRNSRNTGIVAISTARQKWIDNLRDTLAEFHSIIVTEERYPFPKEVDQKLSLLGTKIEFLLNPVEPKSKHIMELINRIYDTQNVDDRLKLDLEFIAAGQAVLKEEWDRIKQEVLK